MPYMILPVQETLRLLLLDTSAAYEPRLSEILRDRWHNVDVMLVKTLEPLEVVLKYAAWDAVLVSYALARRVITTMRKAEFSIPLFILCTPEDEEEAFALLEEGAS